MLCLKLPIKRYFNERRGMSFFNDVKDWIGGFPYECATSEEIELFVTNLGFKLEKKYTVGFKLGCNEFLFKKENLTKDTYLYRLFFVFNLLFVFIL